MDNGEFGWANREEGRFLSERDGEDITEKVEWRNGEKTGVSHGVRDALGNATVGATGIPVIEEVQRAEDQQILVDNRMSEERAIGAPEVAKDGDKKEEEWTRKAEVVIEATRDNPNRRALEVAKLRKDYQMERFNRELGARNG